MSGDHGGPRMTIGSVSRATGIPTNTIRTWERRYGFPEPERTETGQRVYRADVVQHLKLVSEALDAGHRARQVLTMALADLQAMLGSSKVPDEFGEPMVPPAWQKAVRQLDGPTLESALRQECARLGALRFITERVAPFLTWVGEAWASGEVQVHQEHFASDHVRAVLDDTWRSLAPTAPASVVCATLPGELHDLGVHMAAVAVASGGRRPLLLPGSTPVDEIVAAANGTSSRLVAISLSVNANQRASRASLLELRTRLDATIDVWVGGEGAPREVPGVVYRDDLVLLARLG